MSVIHATLHAIAAVNPFLSMAFTYLLLIGAFLFWKRKAYSQEAAQRLRLITWAVVAVNVTLSFFWHPR